jgi:hypothetical protein
MSEQYNGVKFSTFFIEEMAPENDPKLKQLMNWCNEFQKLNLTPISNGASSGNLSYRLQPGSNAFVITGTQLALNRRLSANNFVTVWDVDFTKKTVYAEGLCDPSSESMLHFAIYKMRPDINAIFHGHSEEMLNNPKPNTPINAIDTNTASDTTSATRARFKECSTSIASERVSMNLKDNSAHTIDVSTATVLLVAEASNLSDANDNNGKCQR